MILRRHRSAWGVALAIVGLQIAGWGVARAQSWCDGGYPDCYCYCEPPDGPLPEAAVGSFYQQRYMFACANNWVQEWSLVGGALPPGLSLRVDPVAPDFMYLEGAPLVAGVFAFEIQAYGDWCWHDLSSSIVVAQPGCNDIVIGPDTLPRGLVGAPYAARLTAAGGTPPYRFLLVDGALPSGILLSSWGSLTGTPSSGGFHEITVAAIDAAGCSGTRALALAVECGHAITPPELPHATVDGDYEVQLRGSGGIPPYTFHVAGGSLPPGLGLAATGLLSGRPVSRGVWSATIEMRDAVSCPDSGTFTIPVHGRTDLIAALGAGPDNAARVRSFEPSGALVLDLLAYGSGGHGANVASGELDADLVDEILTGPGPGPMLGPHVRAFRPDGSAIAKVGYYAYGTLRFGVNVGEGDLDDDAFDEIATAPGAGPPFGPHVRGWDVDAGTARPIPGISFHAYATLHYGAGAAAGDVDGGAAELLTAPGPGPTFGPVVRGWAFSSGSVHPVPGLAFQAFATPQYGAQPAAGDLDADARSEISAAPGPGPSLPAALRSFAYAGGVVSAIPGTDVLAYGTLFGARVGKGDATRDGADELLAGPGPDPAASCLLTAYELGPSGLLAVAAPLVAFPDAAYGTAVAGGRLDLP